MKQFRSFSIAIETTMTTMKHMAKAVKRGKWQGVDVSKKPDMTAFEISHYDIQVPLHSTDLQYYRDQIKPNLPWADDHFLERVCGDPLNPGVEWANWPWGKNADKFRMDPTLVGDPSLQPIFDHNYMQRYWPRWAGKFPDGVIPDPDFSEPGMLLRDHSPHRGIYFTYGDLDDIVEELKQDISTRQAVLPMFFPEDTGYRPGRRKPCSIFYHFIADSDLRSLDIVYYLRSCDLVRHFRDDIYLTVRLLLWMIDQLNSAGVVVRPGSFVMSIGNLHCFRADWPSLYGEKR